MVSRYVRCKFIEHETHINRTASHTNRHVDCPLCQTVGKGKREVPMVTFSVVLQVALHRVHLVRGSCGLLAAC